MGQIYSKIVSKIVQGNLVVKVFENGLLQLLTLPANWQSFLRCDRNKVELFEFLAQQVAAKVIQDKELLTTYNEDVISALPFDKEGLSPCNHEEKDTRMLLHAAHASRQGHSKIMIRTVDTDAVVLVIADFYKISVSELWIAFGTGK